MKNATICLAQKRIRPKLDDECLERYEKDLENLSSLIRANAVMSNEDVIELTRDSLCMDDRDRVYGILGILAKYSDEPLVSIDYSLKPKEIYKDFFINYFRLYRDLSFLKFCEMASRPSWVPDLQSLRDSSYPLESRSTRSTPGTLRVLEGDKISISGVHCGTIQISFSSVPFSSSATTIKESITTMLAEILGNISSQSEEAVYEKFIRALLPYELSITTSMTELKTFLKSWQEDVPSNEQIVSSPEGQVLNRIYRNIRGRSCHLTDDGSIILGPGTACNGDHIYVIPGCDIPLVLRRTDGIAYRIIGTCYHSEYVNREALLGKLPMGWEPSYEQGV
ncbi:uncharacterized protein F4822DRAFT_103715 [Hypoxylon trugodes]|uniref:uncharacterized protein n=1 Tax=Hypoxylon trugodes TaxID=326681 RepID=UPI00219560B1|nr:uncharacterized protein F4822DRAFT_103715 [Hypoxylon trugodes]KAI1382717.1 hypothetical protein F4822DRAFT_103715 [Hypoxylon trugodes]